MSPGRWLTLGFGPCGLIGLCYFIAGPATGSTSPATITLPPLVQTSDLSATCRATAAQYRDVLPADWSILVRPPYVLGGDLSPQTLETIYRETIAPTARALSISYFDRPVTQPITVLLLSSPQSYRQCSEALGHGGREEYAGLYVRAQRRLVLNYATGEGTVAHELTHALGHFDFPEMPEWLDEGLASLHEECEFSADGLRLLGSPNWRGNVLQQAMAKRPLPPLAELVTREFGRDGRAALDYAQARYVCLFLQERQLLGAFYRKARANCDIDSTGGWSLAAVLGYDRLEDVDAEFQAWVSNSVPRTTK